MSHIIDHPIENDERLQQVNNQIVDIYERQMDEGEWGQLPDEDSEDHAEERAEEQDPIAGLGSELLRVQPGRLKIQSAKSFKNLTHCGICYPALAVFVHQDEVARAD